MSATGYWYPGHVWYVRTCGDSSLATPFRDSLARLDNHAQRRPSTEFRTGFRRDQPSAASADALSTVDGLGCKAAQQDGGATFERQRSRGGECARDNMADDWGSRQSPEVRGPCHRSRPKQPILLLVQ